MLETLHSLIPQSLFGVFLDTSEKYSSFATPTGLDPSLKCPKGPRNSFLPIDVIQCLRKTSRNRGRYLQGPFL